MCNDHNAACIHTEIQILRNKGILYGGEEFVVKTYKWYFKHQESYSHKNIVVQ